MLTIHLALMILALVCLVLAALNVSAPRINLLALGLAFWAAAIIIV